MSRKVLLLVAYREVHENIVLPYRPHRKAAEYQKMTLYPIVILQ